MKFHVAYFHDIETALSSSVQEAASKTCLVQGVRSDYDVPGRYISRPEHCDTVWQAMGTTSTNCQYIVANSLLRRHSEGGIYSGCWRMQKT